MGNTIVLALLRSPLGRLLGGLCDLEFTGRRSGRAPSSSRATASGGLEPVSPQAPDE
jgi:hypothetical protein